MPINDRLRTSTILYVLVARTLTASVSALFHSAQVEVFNNSGGVLLLYRDYAETAVCGYASSTDWLQCCSSDLCNNLPIPAKVTSLAELEQCYLGATRAECFGAPAFAPAPYTAAARAAA